MKLRTDLCKGANGSPAFAELKRRLQDFLSHAEWTTLLLKGPWGCGKTSAVKSLLEETKDPSNKDRLEIKTGMFSSLAGCGFHAVQKPAQSPLLGPDLSFLRINSTLAALRLPKAHHIAPAITLFYRRITPPVLTFRMAKRLLQIHLFI